ncbi:hypothetical protein K461DRAFT_289662 [Myriangium duriaei CBS 260.36]|uniref:Uncharacterized protein n=1 Tax=Myriangium duriaei CBS 260.36 TaxID=1168546 RepID=A0A9P4J944_9PEZI|nr:hypothetical protein K461DRAFT_289662 [Myriangium duriaei CBS 260.36]
MLLTRDRIPFPRDTQLEHVLGTSVSSGGNTPSSSSFTRIESIPPRYAETKSTTSTSTLRNDAEGIELANNVFRPDAKLPGHPRYKLNKPEQMYSFVEKDICSREVDKLSKSKWLDAQQLPSQIAPLHRQILRGRKIKVMEDPDLHLAFTHDLIFVKPLPRYLLSFDFWSVCLVIPDDHSTLPTETQLQMENISMAALGLIKSYSSLIKHESDFRIAQRDDLALIPGHVTWEQYCTFSEYFDDIQYSEVSSRYRYGELNFEVLRGCSRWKRNTTIAADQSLPYHDIFTPYYGWAVWLLGSFSILLGTYQIWLNAVAIIQMGYPGLIKWAFWLGYWTISWTVLVMASPGIWVAVKTIRGTVIAVRNRKKRPAKDKS